MGEMAMTILTPHHRRAAPVADDLPHPCRHVVKRKADATIGREIRAGGMCQSPVVQQISPGASGIATVRTSSTSTAIFWPHVSMLFDSNLSSWGIISPRRLPGRMRMQPLPGVIGVQFPVVQALVPRYERFGSRFLDL